MADEKDLARLFEELRRSDEASAPPFVATLWRRRTLHPLPRFSILRLASVLVLLAAAALVLVRVRDRAHERAPAERAATIAAWSSPTDWLLATPGRELLAEVPVLLGPLPGEAASAKADEMRTQETPRKGDHS